MALHTADSTRWRGDSLIANQTIKRATNFVDLVWFDRQSANSNLCPAALRRTNCTSQIWDSNEFRIKLIQVALFRNSNAVVSKKFKVWVSNCWTARSLLDDMAIRTISRSACIRSKWQQLAFYKYCSVNCIRQIVFAFHASGSEVVQFGDRKWSEFCKQFRTIRYLAKSIDCGPKSTIEPLVASSFRFD